MALDPEKDLADYLDTNSTAVTLNTNLFYGIVRPISSGIPARAVFVLGTGGPPPQRTLGTTGEIRSAAVQVRTRSTAYNNGRSLAYTVRRTLQSATPSSYMDVMAVQSEPAFLQVDERGLYHWADNYLVRYNSTS